MTDETKDTGAGAEEQREEEPETGPEEMNEDFQARITELEHSAATKDGELAVLKESLANAAAKYRAAILASAPGVPEELVKGDTIEELDTSLELAQGIVSKVRQGLEVELAARSVPAGAPPRTPPDLSTLSPGDKIAHALSEQAR